MRARALALVTAATAVLATSAYVGHRLTTGGNVTEVDVAEAVERFREQVDAADTTTAATSPTTTPAPGVDLRPPAVGVGTTTSTTAATVPATTPELPAPGVYQYATSGFDEIDALTGARHDYPALTTITVIPHDCGVRLRWDVAVERWSTWDWCLDGAAIEQTGWVAYHEFFGVGGRNDYSCDGEPRPLDAPVDSTWTMTCRMEDRTTTVFAGTVIGHTELSIDGTDIQVQHLRYEVDIRGESIGTQTVEGWYRTSDGLPVREIGTVATVQSTVIGTTNFVEEYSIELLAPTPTS